ncbi:MAG: hypothetical protein ABIG68_09795 [Acidobacteriota bacterium]
MISTKLLMELTEATRGLKAANAQVKSAEEQFRDVCRRISLEGDPAQHGKALPRKSKKRTRN